MVILYYIVHYKTFSITIYDISDIDITFLLTFVV